MAGCLPLWSRIMTEQYGAAAILLVQIKDFVKARDARKQTLNGGYHKAIASLRPHKFVRKVGGKGC